MAGSWLDVPCYNIPNMHEHAQKALSLRPQTRRERLCGGAVALESRESEGTIRIPPRKGRAMNAICVDDEAQVLAHTVSCCQKLQLLEEVRGFTRPQEALDWAAKNPVDLAVLDIHMPDMNGLELAKRLRKAAPGLSILFVTACSQYALEAFEVHPTAYLLKPLDQTRLKREVEYALSLRQARPSIHIRAQTFGHFEILVDGETLSFRRSKSKELLAYLVDRRGAGVTRQDAFAALWEDRVYDASMQKQMDVVIRSLRDTLQKYGVGELFELKSRCLRIRPELIDCDLYRFLRGDGEAVSTFFGEYMSQYAWAANTEARLSLLQSSRL